LGPSDRRIVTFLFVVQSVGAVFVGIFLAAYLGGLPSTAVLHSEPVFRVPLIIFGGALLVLVLAVSVLAFLSKERAKLPP
jgi:hypothetical protein